MKSQRKVKSRWLILTVRTPCRTRTPCDHELSMWYAVGAWQSMSQSPGETDGRECIGHRKEIELILSFGGRAQNFYNSELRCNGTIMRFPRHFIDSCNATGYIDDRHGDLKALSRQAGITACSVSSSLLRVVAPLRHAVSRTPDT